MLFNSFNFWIIFPFIFILYWFIPCSNKINTRKYFLIIVSYLLYMMWNPYFSLVLFYVTVITYTAAKSIYRHRNDNRRKKKWICAGFIFFASFPLLFFKYYNFINHNISQFLCFVGLSNPLPGLNWAIPVGISFFTFQAISYSVDVYYGKIKKEECFSDYLLFCSFFPQTASGPISKFSSLMPQIKTCRTSRFDYNKAVEGLRLLLWGMVLKVVMADQLCIYVDTVYSNYHIFSGLNCFIASLFYTLQIYGDFCGYSLMAVGIAKTIGFDLVNNFDRPYLATSITNFWKRWHISLTRWLTDYIYIPLGGSRCSKTKHYSNILITFLVSGLWHGASWTFVIWGALHGLFQILEKMIGVNSISYNGKPIARMLAILTTFFLVNFAWIFFRMPTVSDAYSFIGRIITLAEGNFTSLNVLFPLLVVFIPILIFKEIVEERQTLNGCVCDFLSNKHTLVRWGSYLFLIIYLLLYGVLDNSQFIYVNF